MQSMHQPYPCYLLKQSFWNPIWGQCRLNKISFWFGLPLRMGLLCFSRRNKQARKVCPALHGWWCDLRITIRPFMLPGFGISSTSCTVLSFFLSICFPSVLPLIYLRGKAVADLNTIVYFGICLIAAWLFEVATPPHPPPAACLCIFLSLSIVTSSLPHFFFKMLNTQIWN